MRALGLRRDRPHAHVVCLEQSQPVFQRRGGENPGELRLQLLEEDPVATDECRVVLADVRLPEPVWRRGREVDEIDL